MDIAGHWGIPLFAGSTSIITQGGAKYPRWTFWWPNASFWPSFGYWPWKITLRSYLSVDSHMGIRSHMLDFGNPRFPVSRIPIWESCCFRIPIWESGDLQLQMLGNWAAVLWKTKEKLCYNRVQKFYASNTNYETLPKTNATDMCALHLYSANCIMKGCPQLQAES